MVIHRFQKKTIRSAEWEIKLTDNNPFYELHKLHFCREDGRIIHEDIKSITKDQAEKYLAENSKYHIETYKI